MSEQSSIIRQAAEILVDAKEKVGELLSKLPEANLSLAVGPKIQSVINNLYFLSGTIAPQEHYEKAVEFPPVTNFMGEEITLPKPVTKEDLTPAEYEKALFIDSVNRLYDEFPSLSADGILNSHTLPEHVIILRGVAKKAGVPGYEDRSIDKSFVDDIAFYIKEKEAEEQKQKEIDEQIRLAEEAEKKGSVVNDPAATGDQVETEGGDDGDDDLETEGDSDLVDHVLTDVDFQMNPGLAELGLKVGDTIKLSQEEIDQATAQAKEAEEQKQKDQEAKQSKKGSAKK